LTNNARTGVATDSVEVSGTADGRIAMARTDFTMALDRTKEIELGTVGHASGRQTSRPVWFVREGSTLFLLPLTGSASHWFRNVLHTPEVHLAAGGVGCDVTVRPITDTEDVRRVVDVFRAKYGDADVANYYQHPDVAVEATLD
jgi:hypothetical protein